MKNETKNMLLLLMAVLLIAAAVYIGFEKINQAKQAYVLQGYNQGATGAIIAIYQNTENCQVATLNLGNVTRNVADVQCFQKALEIQQRQQ